MARKYDPQAGSLFKKEVPEMPEGYYSGDKPNSTLRNFVTSHMTTIPVPDNYSPAPYLSTIKASKAHAVYNMHAYPSKKPFDAVQAYIMNFTSQGNLVLDPFCGSGGTLYCSLQTGRATIGIDLSPAATFIAKGLCTPYDAERFQTKAESLLTKLEGEFGAFYITKCAICGGNAEISTIAWSMVFRCPKCLNCTPLYESSDAEDSKAKGMCSCGQSLKAKDKTNKWLPVRVEYRCLGTCKGRLTHRRTANGPNQKEADLFKQDYDRILSLEAEHAIPSSNFPEFDFPERARVQVLRPRGIIHHSQVYSSRNRAVAERLWQIIMEQPSPTRDVLQLWFSSSILSLTLFERDREGGGGNQSGTMYIPYNCKDRNPFNSLRTKISHIRKGLEMLSQIPCTDICISTQDSSNLNAIPSDSIDYVFTDPPYADKVQYWELNCIWEAWLGLDREWSQREAVVNLQRGLTEDHWAALFAECFREIYRVLKPGRFLSLCFHGGDLYWTLLQDILCEIGFQPDGSVQSVAIDSVQKSFKQLRRKEANVRKDLVINFRKPKIEEVSAAITITGEEDKRTFNEKVCNIIRDYLSANPGITKDRIYDEVVSRMVRSGQMEAHDFNELLQTVAEEVKTPVMKNLFEKKEPDLFGTHEVGRWYLKETELVIADAAENAREDLAAEKIGAFIKGFLKKHAGDEGVHYSDLFEHYIYAVKDKPRRQLTEFLPDYFYKTDLGTWRLPSSEEEEKAKREARVKGLGRRVKRYIAQLEQGAIIHENERPNDATIAEWIRHCKRAGLYEQGKLLYDKGGLNTDNLPEEAMVNVEEDYQVCVRMIARGAGGESPKKRKRKGE